MYQQKHLKRLEMGSFILRIVMGIIFIFHGVDKFIMGMDSVSTMFNNFGISGFFAYVIATLEVVGGAALILGLETKIFAALFGIQMIVATLYVSWEKGLINGFEIDLLLFACCVHLTINGSSWLSLDNVFHGGRRRVQSEEA